MSEVDLKKFVDDRLISLRDYPRMWGSPEAIELQAITFLEVEHYVRTGVSDRHVLDTYVKMTVTQGHSPAALPLYMKFKNQDNLISTYDVETFAKTLYEICQAVRETLAHE
jgi:hypothetical protein